MSTMTATQFFEVDLHVHTPASSSDYEDKAASFGDIVRAAVDAGLAAIAVTDHNTIAGIESVRDAAKGSGLSVFPGVEINADGGHIIALFDPMTQLEIVETCLIEAGIPKIQFGDAAKLGKKVQEVLAVIVANKGIAIAAHADGPKGFIQTNQQGQAKIRVYKDENLSAMELLSLALKDQYVEGKVAGYDRPMACIQASDAHSLSRIGSRRIYLRMQHITLEGVRQAFSDPKARIRFPGEWNPEKYPYISGL